ncbi:hypothetical protein L3Q82_005101 [Scortum barcoo]|uniref:Uncharacterized protein n=1 Tax=Scortum barcoo TaxID=214431 RepID=A0ACB8VEF3_9TELE|nr:hypothetical protein L3Q82_005101 [Scortum barcoo]
MKPSQEKNLSPFNFIHNDVEYLALCQDGRQVPAKAFQPQFGQGISVREFYNMFIATGRHLKDLPLSINHKEFNEGYSLFVFNLEPCEDSDALSPASTGNLRLEMRFRQAPPPHHHTRGVRLLLFNSQRAPPWSQAWGWGSAGRERLVAGSLPTGTRPGSARNGGVGPPSSK